MKKENYKKCVFPILKKAFIKSHVRYRNKEIAVMCKLAHSSVKDRCFHNLVGYRISSHAPTGSRHCGAVR